jgi:hypothetical protein
MKPDKKNGQDLYLQKNRRWKWMAGATAATAAGVTASQASTITINLLNNYISGSGGNHLNADLTGDGHPDLTIAGAGYRSFFFTNTTYCGTCRSGHRSASAQLNGVSAFAKFQFGIRIGYYNFLRLGSQYDASSLMGSIPIFFKDLHINGGAPTLRSLEVTVSGGATIQLDSLTYNTLGQGSRLGLAVPDQGSSLALLAMGAGGILALRRRRTAQGRS